ncbi:MAG: hypothetical protein CW338_08080 [Clostridiales bacterium]|nr:hypothetical protein [Clostridiales bacterium]
MIREGIVKESKNGMLSVCFERPEACEKCGACGGSSHTHLAQVKGEAQTGDRVAVEMPEAKVLKISVLVYAIPLAALILGLLIGCLLIGNDIAGACIGLGLLAVSYFMLKLIDRRIAARPEYAPQLIAVVPAQKTADTAENIETENVEEETNGTDTEQ